MDKKLHRLVAAIVCGSASSGLDKAKGARPKTISSRMSKISREVIKNRTVGASSSHLPNVAAATGTSCSKLSKIRSVSPRPANA
jgi:hypothetical protein